VLERLRVHGLLMRAEEVARRAGSRPTADPGATGSRSSTRRDRRTASCGPSPRRSPSSS
jgi:hypothetical protein